MMISAFHLHELTDLHEHHDDQLVIEDIHLCPICDAVFEYDFDIDVDTKALHVSGEIASALQEQLFTQRIFTDKDGRSPPVFVS